jgi:Ca2+-binding EF-hand superfamily protein
MGNTNTLPTTLTEQNVKSLVNIWGLQENEVKAAFEQFKSNHPTGQMNRKDFGVLMQRALPKKAAVKMSDHLFRIYDKDNNGKIDFLELMAVYQIMAKGSPEQVLNQIFLAFDTNRDGYINHKEMKTLVKDMMMLIQEEDNPQQATEDIIASNAFREMDKNANGKISAEEFVTACMAQDSFSKLLAIKIMDIFVDDE